MNAILLLLALFAADPIRIGGDIKVSEYKLGRISILNVPAGDDIFIFFELADVDWQQLSPTEYVFTGRPGTYPADVKIFGRDKDKNKVQVAFKQSITIEPVARPPGPPVPPGPVPPVPPIVPPGPVVPDPPKAAKLWINLFYDPEAKLTYVADIIADPDLRRQIEAKGHKFINFDVKGKYDDGYTSKINEVGLPALLIQDQATRKFLYAGPCPKTAAELLVEVQKCSQ